MPRAKHLSHDLTDAEEAEIQAGIAQDPDNPELTQEQLAGMRPAIEVLPPALYAALVKRGRGRPPSERKKVEVKLRLDPDVIERFKAGGPGWQTRMNDVLKRSDVCGPDTRKSAGPGVKRDNTGRFVGSPRRPVRGKKSA